MNTNCINMVLSLQFKFLNEISIAVFNIPPGPAPLTVTFGLSAPLPVFSLNNPPYRKLLKKSEPPPPPPPPPEPEFDRPDPPSELPPRFKAFRISESAA